LRNRWKWVGEEEEEVVVKNGEGRSPERKKMAAPLDSYRLEYMLEVVFAGFDEAAKVAEGYVRGGLDWADDDTDMLEVAERAEAGDDEDQWEFMVEAMDWEAV
jgi:hypothetical protein